MRLDTLIIMQEVIRHPEHIPRMVEYVSKGGFWTPQALSEHAQATGGRADQIYISVFPDGVKMIHDGHHRIVATFIAGRNQLFPQEYITREWTYEAYMEIAFDRQYVTPHDPRKEVRVADFRAFKNQVLELAKASREEAAAYILAHKDDFAKPRQMKTVSELASTVSAMAKRVA